MGIYNETFINFVINICSVLIWCVNLNNNVKKRTNTYETRNEKILETMFCVSKSI